LRGPFFGGRGGGGGTRKKKEKRKIKDSKETITVWGRKDSGLRGVKVDKGEGGLLIKQVFNYLGHNKISRAGLNRRSQQGHKDCTPDHEVIGGTG